MRAQRGYDVLGWQWAGRVVGETERCAGLAGPLPLDRYVELPAAQPRDVRHVPALKSSHLVGRLDVHRRALSSLKHCVAALPVSGCKEGV